MVCIILGDFNEVLQADDRGSRRLDEVGVWNFRRFI